MRAGNASRRGAGARVRSACVGGDPRPCGRHASGGAHSLERVDLVRPLVRRTSGSMACLEVAFRRTNPRSWERGLRPGSRDACVAERGRHYVLSSLRVANQGRCGMRAGSFDNYEIYVILGRHRNLNCRNFVGVTRVYLFIHAGVKVGGCQRDVAWMSHVLRMRRAPQMLQALCRLWAKVCAKWSLWGYWLMSCNVRRLFMIRLFIYLNK